MTCMGLLIASSRDSIFAPPTRWGHMTARSQAPTAFLSTAVVPARTSVVPRTPCTLRLPRMLQQEDILPACLSNAASSAAHT